MMHWMIAVIALITAALSWLLFYQKQQAIDKPLFIYWQFCKKLAKRGLSRNPGEGEKAFAERVKITLPEQIADIDQITEIFIKLRYGRVSNKEDLAQFNKRVTGFKV